MQYREKALAGWLGYVLLFGAVGVVGCTGKSLEVEHKRTLALDVEEDTSGRLRQEMMEHKRTLATDMGRLRQVPLRQLVLDGFVGEVGVVEVGADNSGARVEEYLRSCGLGPGYAWCACFVTWGFSQFEVPNPASAWSPDWFRGDAVVFERGRDGVEFDGFRPLDVIGIWFGSKGRIAHVGVVERREGNFVITVEGNTNDEGSREGDGVYRKRRAARQIYAVSRYID